MQKNGYPGDPEEAPSYNCDSITIQHFFFFQIETLFIIVKGREYPEAPSHFTPWWEGIKSSRIIILANIRLSHFNICFFAEVQSWQMTGDRYGCVQLYRCRAGWFTRQQDSQLQQHLPDAHSGGPAAHVETLLTEPLHQLHAHIASPVKTRACKWLRAPASSGFLFFLTNVCLYLYMHVGMRRHVHGSAVTPKSIYL